MRILDNFLIRIYLFFSFFFAAAILASCATPRNYDLGQQAYHQHNYHAAFIYFTYAAKRGDHRAEYPLGYMLFYGIGAPQDQAQALVWLRKAAASGDENAIRALHNLDSNMMASLIWGGRSGPWRGGDGYVSPKNR